MRTARLWLRGFAIVALVALAAGSASAQQGTPPLTPDRSTAIQAQLAKIDQDRAAFVDQFLTGWSPYVDSRVYDLWSELRPVAMKVPAWQLYGASLVGNFQTMLKILTGREGAGTYINALTEPQPKAAADSGVAADLGSYTDSLVYVPISPCRVADTRGTGARTGVLAAGASRSFDLTTEAFVKGQGVTGTPCVGLPAYSYFGWAVNITVVGGGNGWLTAWGYSKTKPVASVINYGTAPYAIANAMTLTGCDGCADDITISADGAPAHVIIDVVGYYKNAIAANATVTRVAGTPVTLNANTYGWVTGGACPAGTSLVGGEIDHNGDQTLIGESRQNTATTWIFWMVNNMSISTPATAYSRCIDTPTAF